MAQLFTVREGLFDKYGEMTMSPYQWFTAEKLDMEDCFKAGDKEKALEHENNAMWAIYFTDHKDVVNDMEYEMYISKCTQLPHPRRKLTIRKDD